MTLDWLFFARGDFQRAVTALRRDIANSDGENRVIRRALNDRMMKVGVCSWLAFPHGVRAGQDGLGADGRLGAGDGADQERKAWEVKV